MNFDRWIGSTAARTTAAACALTAVCLFTWTRFGNAAGYGRAFTYLGVMVALVSVAGAVVSSRRAYAGWMKFASTLQDVMVMVLFGICYVILVPFFWLLLRKADPLKLRVQSGTSDTFWRKRPPEQTDPDSYLRMG